MTGCGQDEGPAKLWGPAAEGREGAAAAGLGQAWRTQGEGPGKRRDADSHSRQHGPGCSCLLPAEVGRSEPTLGTGQGGDTRRAQAAVPSQAEREAAPEGRTCPHRSMCSQTQARGRQAWALAVVTAAAYQHLEPRTPC